jgi:hypothetical protein
MTKTPARGTKKYKKVPLFGRVDKRRQPRPDIAAIKKAQWENPEYRAKMSEALKASHKADPEKYSRLGVPKGHTRESVAPLWQRARELADRFIQIMKDKGELPQDEQVQVVTEDGVQTVSVPSTDNGKAEAALKEAFVLAVGPSDQKIKIQAINTVLNFTKSKPESKTKLTVNPMSFLDEIADD